MPNHKPQLYQGGYGSQQFEKISKVQLPDRIKCNGCQRNLMQTKYSGNQLKAYQNSIAIGAPELPRCSNCVGSQILELKCLRCDLIKSTEAFAKTHRRNPDNALCKDCQQDVCDVEPNVVDALHEQKIMESHSTVGSTGLRTNSSLYSSASMSEAGDDNYSPLNRNSGSESSAFNLGRSTPAAGSVNGVWMSQDPDPLNSAASPVLSVTPSVVNSTGTAWDGFARQQRNQLSGHVETRSDQQTGSGRQSSKWAKQNAVKPEKGSLLAAQKLREDQRRVQEQERARFNDDDDEGSDWEP